MHAPGEDCFTLGSSQAVEQDCRIPRGGHCIPAQTRLSGVFCAFPLETSLSRRGNKRLEKDEHLVHAASRVMMSGFLLLRSCFCPLDILSVAPVLEGRILAAHLPTPSRCELAQGCWSSGAVWVELTHPLASCQAWALPWVMQRAHRAGRDRKALQHPAPWRVEERVWALSLPVPESWGSPPAQPMGHLPLARRESAGLCRRNVTSAFPAPGGQILMGTLPVRDGEGRRTTGLSGVTAQ